MRARIKFAKHDELKFVGHLDMVRYFQRAFRRAGFDVKYSEGFSPHMILSFAAPLGVGLESRGEYFDIELNSSPDRDEALMMLRNVMASQVEVIDYQVLPEDSKNAMSVVAAASYELYFRSGYRTTEMTDEAISAALKSFYSDASEIMITKKTKKSERTLDIKPLIYEFTYDGNKSCFFMTVSTGSVDNIKPELVMEHFFASAGFSYSEYTFMITRTETYMRDDEGKLVALLT